MDLLSDVLGVLHLRGAIFFTAHIRGAWSIESPDPEALARLLGLRRECVALFHLVAEGSCRVALEGGEPIVAGPGSIVILPRGDRHLLGSDLSRKPTRLKSIFFSWSGPEVPCLRQGDGAPETRLVCGYLRCDQRFNPLVGALPALLVDHPGDGVFEAVPHPGAPGGLRAQGEDDGWLARTFRHTVEEAEARRPGSAVMLPRLAELMFVEVLRRYMRLLPKGETGWLAAARDARVGRALRLLHEAPARKWRVADLARESGMSRSAMGERFQSLVGESPMRYLTRWRMHLAEQLLPDPELAVAQVASQVGFDSAVAFHRAFKRQTGLTPVEWREARAQTVHRAGKESAKHAAMA